MTVNELINKLAKPTYVYRMARAHINHTNPGLRKSAETRLQNAKREIIEIMTQVMEEGVSY